MKKILILNSSQYSHFIYRTLKGVYEGYATIDVEKKKDTKYDVFFVCGNLIKQRQIRVPLLKEIRGQKDCRVVIMVMDSELFLDTEILSASADYGIKKQEIWTPPCIDVRELLLSLV